MQTGVLVETIRYYESKGLLQLAARGSNNYRAYGTKHLARLTFIQRCRSLNLSQDEIRALIDLQEQPQRSCIDVNELLDAHLGQLSARIDELQSLQSQIQSIRDACSGTSSIGACAALESLASADEPAKLASTSRAAHTRRSIAVRSAS